MLSARLIDALVPRAGGWSACMSDESNDYYLGRTAEEWFVERVLIAAVEGVSAGGVWLCGGHDGEREGDAAPLGSI